MRGNTIQNRKQKRSAHRIQEGIITDKGMLIPKTFGFIKEIEAITDNQELAFDHWDDGFNLMLHGFPGTGKTYIALGLALEEVFEKDSPYEKVYIVRSTVQGREQGFFPGTAADKEKCFEEPYIPICTKFFGRSDAYTVLKSRNQIEFVSTCNLRGKTFENCIILVDEAQNMNDAELHTIMTRIGENSRIIFCGDIKQDDLSSERKKEHSGLRDFMRIINNMSEFEFVEFVAEDIVRSKLIKSYIIARDKLGL